MNAKETQAQTIKDEELELTKDYYAHHLTRSYYSPTGFANEFLSRNPNFKDKITDIYAFFFLKMHIEIITIKSVLKLMLLYYGGTI